MYIWNVKPRTTCPTVMSRHGTYIIKMIKVRSIKWRRKAEINIFTYDSFSSSMLTQFNLCNRNIDIIEETLFDFII